MTDFTGHAPERPSPLEAKRDRAAVRLIRKSFQEGIKHAGKNATVHCGDVLHLLDEFAAGRFDDKLDEAHDSVTGPHYPEGIS